MTAEEKIAYKIEGRRRILIRQAIRKRKWTEKVKRYGRGAMQCPSCSNFMSWCLVCEVWSRTCCVDYGTCQCS